MNEHALQQYLYEHIPLTKAMQVAIVKAQLDEVIVVAPLAPNINHHDTIFGGSASAVAIIAAWSLLHVRLESAAIANRLVIHSNSMQYDAPINGTFTAHARLENPDAWHGFTRMLARKGKARIAVISTLHYSGAIAGRLRGEFVALAP